MRSSSLSFFSFAMLMLLGATYAHICILSPLQRGGIPGGLTPAGGDSPCFKRAPNCGKVPAGNNSEVYHVGASALIYVHQNLNHWNFRYDGQDTSAPLGFFDLAVSYDGDDGPNATWSPLAQWADFPANDMVNKQNFTRIVTFTQASDHAVLRFRYYSYNLDEGAYAGDTESIFFQCADVKIVDVDSSGEKTAFTADDAPAPRMLHQQTHRDGISASSPDPHDCCVPLDDQIRIFDTVTSDFSTGDVVEQQRVWFLASHSPLVARARSDGNGNLVITTITNYSDPNHPEYVIKSADQSCAVYGGDTFYNWCYGSSRGMQFTGTSDFGTTNIWDSPSNGFIWKVDATTCHPTLFVDTEQSLSTTYTFVGYSQDMSVFAVPPACHHPSALKVNCDKDAAATMKTAGEDDSTSPWELVTMVTSGPVEAIGSLVDALVRRLY